MYMYNAISMYFVITDIEFIKNVCNQAMVLVVSHYILPATNSAGCIMYSTQSQCTMCIISLLLQHQVQYVISRSQKVVNLYNLLAPNRRMYVYLYMFI